MPTIIENSVCVACKELNLIEEIKISRCADCARIYCIHFASNIDPHKCVECLSDISLIKETITKEYTHYNEETDVVTSYKRRAKSIRLEGMDWLFAQRKIRDLNDDSLELAIEYHQAILKGLLDEREQRRNKHAHRYAGLPTPKTSSTDTSTTSTTSTTTKTTKTIKSSKPQATANAVLQALLAKGLKPEQIAAMLANANKKS